MHSGTSLHLPGQRVPLNTSAQYRDHGTEGYAVVRVGLTALGVGGVGGIRASTLSQNYRSSDYRHLSLQESVTPPKPLLFLKEQT